MSDGKAAFARRLNQAFDRLEIPAKQRGRFTALSRLFGVSPVAARDWCEGNSYPSVDKLLVIMDTVRCGADWLLFGRGSDGTTFDQPPVPSAITSCERTDPATRIQSQAGGTPLNWLLQSGDSMSPGVRPGDEVGYRPGLAGPLSDGLHVLLPVSTVGPATGLTPLVRRCHRRLDGLIEVACDNPLYPERERYREGASGHLTAIRAEGCDVEVVGRVIELRTRLE